MTQATIEWLPTSIGNLIGCDDEGKVVYKWLIDNSEETIKAKYLIEVWVAAREYQATIAAGDPKAFGGQAEKDKILKSATNQVEYLKAKAAKAVDEAYGIF